jgi:hypothetical protein
MNAQYKSLPVLISPRLIHGLSVMASDLRGSALG